MATDQSFVEYIQSQCGLSHELAFKKMFGEYALYLHGKVVAFACDNQLYLKPTEEGRALLGNVSEHPPYPGARLYFRLDEQVEDRELLRKAFETTARALPLPKSKATAKAAHRKTTRTGKPRGASSGESPNRESGDPTQHRADAVERASLPGRRRPC